MDKTLIMTKHFEVYLSLLQIGLGILYVPDYKALHIHLLVFEIIFDFSRNRDEWDDRL